MPSAITSQSTFSLRADGTLLRDGAPFFFWGHYAPGFVTGYEGFKRLLELTAATGGNLLASSYLWSESLARNVELWDYAASLGVGLLLNDIDTAWPEQMSAYGAHRAAFGVESADDANNYTPATITTKSSTYRTAMPKLFTYLSQSTGTAYPNGTRADYAKAAMTIGNQIYPVPSGALSELVTQMELVVGDCAAASPKTLPVVNIDWQKKTNGSRIATPQEHLAMTALALIGGARGLLNFALADQYNRQGNSPEQLAAVRRSRARFAPYVGYFLNGTRTRVNLTSSMVYAASFSLPLGGRTLWVVCNSISEPRPVTLNVGTSDVWSTGGLKLQGARVSGTLPGFGVAIVETR